MRANALIVGLVAGLVVVATVRPAAQGQVPASNERKLQLTFDGNGYVSLVAQNVTVRDVFTEWTRVGGSVIVNADRLPMEMLSVQFEMTTETKLVESLIRLSKAKNAGFVVVPRLVDAPVTPSRVARIQILPTSSPSTSYMSTSTQISTFPQTSPDDELPPVTPVFSGGPGSPPAQPPQQQQPNRGPGVYVPPTGPVPPIQGTTGRGGPPVPPTGQTGRGGGQP